jgi:hypothetical protein
MTLPSHKARTDNAAPAYLCRLPKRPPKTPQSYSQSDPGRPRATQYAALISFVEVKQHLQLTKAETPSNLSNPLRHIFGKPVD